MDDAPWPLPASWRWCRFDEVARVASNLVDPADFQDWPHIAPNCIESETGRLLPCETIAHDGVTSPKHRFSRGQILYSKIRPYLAKVVVADFDGLCSADMYPIESELDARFLKWWMLSREFTRRAAGEQARTVLPKINVRALSALPVPVPPLGEQRWIVEILEDHLSRLDAADDYVASARTRAVAMRASVLAHLWAESEQVGKLRPVADLGRVVTGATPRHRVANQDADTLPFVTPGDIGHGDKVGPVARSLPRNSISPSRVLRTPGVLAVCIGATLGKVGWTARPVATNQQINAVLVEPNVAGFVSALMASPAFQSQMHEAASATTMPILNKRQFSKLQVPIPSPPEQQKLLGKLDSLLEAVRAVPAAAHQVQRREESLRRTLLHAAFSGRLTRNESAVAS